MASVPSWYVERVRRARVRVVPRSAEEEAAFRRSVRDDPKANALLGVYLDAADFVGASRTLLPQVWLEVPIADRAWLVRYRVIARRGRPVVVELRVESNGGPSTEDGITSRRVLSELTIASHLESKASDLRTTLRKVYGPDAINGHAPPKGKGGRTGRPAVETSDVELAQLAQRYVELNDDPSRKLSVIATLAKEWGKDPKTIQNRLTLARKRGLLSSPPPGISGGRLMIKAKLLLMPNEPAGRRRGAKGDGK